MCCWHSCRHFMSRASHICWVSQLPVIMARSWKSNAQCWSCWPRCRKARLGSFLTCMVERLACTPQECCHPSHLIYVSSRNTFPSLVVQGHERTVCFWRCASACVIVKRIYAKFDFMCRPQSSRTNASVYGERFDNRHLRLMVPRIPSCALFVFVLSNVYRSSRQSHDGFFLFDQRSRFVSDLLSWEPHTMTGMHTFLRSLCRRLA